MKSIIYTAIAFIFLNWSFAYSQEHVSRASRAVFSDSTAAVDSAKIIKRASSIDSLKIKTDSTKLTKVDTVRIDSVRIRFIPGMGKIADQTDTLSMLNQTQFLWSDSKYAGELIWKVPGFFWGDLGEAGKWGNLNAFGLDGRYVGILMDGRPMNDPVTGTYNIYDIPLEFIDYAEILTGPVSNITADGQNVTMNFITRSYNSFRPMTKLRFVQDPKNTVLTDGLYTQNIARGLNLMIGFMRQASQGYHYQIDLNGNIIPTLDAWNIRTRLRYNISNKLNIAFSDYYTKATNGLNGGIDISQSVSIFDPTGAILANELSFDKRSRHDLTLSSIARIFSDSSSTTQASIYYSTLDREYWNPPDFNNGRLQKIDDSTKSSFWGIYVRQQLPLKLIRLIVGGQWERRKSDSTRTLHYHVNTEKSLFMQAELHLTNLFIPSVSIRSVSLNGVNVFNSGIGIKSQLKDWLTIFADASWYDRFPTIQEQYWVDSTIIRQGEILKEQHKFIQCGFNIDIASDLKLNLTYYQRKIKNAIAYLPATTMNASPAIKISNINEVDVQGINGNIMLNWNRFEFYGVMTLTRYKQDGIVKTLMPDVLLGGELSYRDNFFNEKLDAKFGVRSYYYNHQQGMQFDPQTLSYVQYNSNILGRSTTFDLFMVLKIGDAHLSLSWDNFLDTGYILSPIYPMPGRQIRLGVNWVFMD